MNAAVLADKFAKQRAQRSEGRFPPESFTRTTLPDLRCSKTPAFGQNLRCLHLLASIEHDLHNSALKRGDCGRNFARSCASACSPEPVAWHV